MVFASFLQLIFQRPEQNVIIFRDTRTRCQGSPFGVSQYPLRKRIDGDSFIQCFIRNFYVERFELIDQLTPMSRLVSQSILIHTSTDGRAETRGVFHETFLGLCHMKLAFCMKSSSCFRMLFYFFHHKRPFLSFGCRGLTTKIGELFPERIEIDWFPSSRHKVTFQLTTHFCPLRIR